MEGNEHVPAEPEQIEKNPLPSTESVEASCTGCGTKYTFEIPSNQEWFTFECPKDGIQTKWSRGTD